MDLPDIHLSHDNCPRQVILCGIESSIRTCQERLSADRVLCQELPFRSGFHSPLFSDYIKPHQTHFASLPIQTPKRQLWSANTASVFDSNADVIRQTAIDHLVEPVRFRELIQNMYAAGGRVFVQMGTGSLAGFVGDTLRGTPHVALSILDDRRPALRQISRFSQPYAYAAMELIRVRVGPATHRHADRSCPSSRGPSGHFQPPPLPTTQSPIPANLDTSDRSFNNFRDS